MDYLQIVSIGFYIWWLFINGWLYTAEFSFIQSFTGIQGKKYMIPYVLLSDTLTFLMMYCNSAGVPRLILHMGLIVCFCRFLLNLKWIAAIAPTMIVLTLSTFMEGFQTISMRWLVKQNVGEYIGIVIQMLVSGTLAILLVITLQFVAKKYAYTGQQKISSYLYALLLPCVFIVWVVRSGLGLDMRMNQSFKDQSDLWALIWILGACAIFFIILKLVSKIITLSKEETEQKRLQDQIKRQYIYLEEAKKRNEQYRMFQHDINNHFLVLSGLIREKNYDKAKEYFDKLHKTSDKLLIGIESGNPVIDILLNEKVNFAKLNGIEVKHDIKNLADCSVEDMDLCIILANAIDNAIQACIKEKNVHPEIVIAVRRRHHFLIAEVTNTMLPENYTFEYGTGLENIKHIVEKYEGTMEIETSENCFRLSILLCLLPFANME